MITVNSHPDNTFYSFPIFFNFVFMIHRSLHTGFLALLLLLQATAWWAFLQVREASREREVAVQLEAGVKEGEVHVLRIPKSWEAGGHPHFQHVERGEVRYYGRMYDIFRIEDQGDTILYHGIYDHEETELFETAARDLSRKGEYVRLPLLLSCCPAVADVLHLPGVHPPQSYLSCSFHPLSLPANQWVRGPSTPPPEARS